MPRHPQNGHLGRIDDGRERCATDTTQARDGEASALHFHDADKKDVYELADALADLSAKARDGKLTAKEMQG
ncbi:MAG: 2-oxo acid dehydrogenase subunit E2, partial [Pseudomonadota bacterium]